MAVTRMSSKGQVVIPADMRIGIEEGEDLLILRNENQIIIEKASRIAKKLREDLEFAKRTGAAMKRYEEGKFIKMSDKDFLKEIETW